MCRCMGYGTYCEADSWDFRIGFCLEIMHVNMEGGTGREIAGAAFLC